MRTYEQARLFRGKMIRLLAQNNSNLCDKSGVGFWPVPLLMPAIFAKCLLLLQAEIIKKQIISSDNVAARHLTEIRNLLAELATKGDLGEDHTGIYIEDHPFVSNLDIKDGPFYEPYKKILDLENPFKMLGFIYSIEVGSLEAIKALIKTRIITKGSFAELHNKAEVRHEKIALLILEKVMAESVDSRYRTSFVAGCERHDNIYENL